MEAHVFHSSSDQSMSCHNSRTVRGRKNGPLNLQQAGILPSPPPTLAAHHPQQPPLLPLPIPLLRGLSCPPTLSKTNQHGALNSSLAPRKSSSLSTTFKNLKQRPKPDFSQVQHPGRPVPPDIHWVSPISDAAAINLLSNGSQASRDFPHARSKKTPIITEKPSSSESVISSTKLRGTQKPMESPKDVPKTADSLEDKGGKFSGSLGFTLSPPPSSLPLPTFAMRPKLGCNPEAVEFDAGATNKLHRLLRLR